MQINNCQINNCQINNKLSFCANLKLCGKELTTYLKKNRITDLQIKALKDKFEKATKETEGIIELDFGSYYPDKMYMSEKSKIRYINGEYDDYIGVFFEDEKLSSNSKFVDKLVKMLDIFKMREKDFQKISKLRERKEKEHDFEKLRERISRLSKKTKENSYKAAKELFDIPYSGGCCGHY